MVMVLFLALGVLTIPRDVAAAAPGDCNLGTVTQPVGLPFGTSFWLHNDFAGTHNSSAPSTINYSDSANHTTGVLGVGPTTCVLNGLSFNSTDGYLYAFENPEVQNSPLLTASPLVKIGRDAAGNMAMSEVATQPSIPTLPAPAANDMESFAAAMNASGQLSIPGLYVNLVNLFDTDQLAPSILNFQPDGSYVDQTPESFSASCVPYLQNLMGQYAIYFQSLAWNATHPTAPQWMQVAPEGGLQDWAFSPTDGQLYGYAAVDLRDSAYPRGGGPVVGGTQTYLGKTTAIAPEPWFPPGVAGNYTITRQPDWVLKINPTTGATNCAQADGPPGFQSGAIALPISPTQPTTRDPEDDSSFDPTYGPGGQTTTILAGGGSEIAGTSFSADGHMQLFESEESRHWDFDPSTCAFNATTAATCQPPTLVAEVLPGGRQRGDAASAVFPVTLPLTVTKTIDGPGAGTFDIGASATIGGTPSTDRASLVGGQTASLTVATGDGRIVVDERSQPGWSLESATCGAPGETVDTTAATVTFTITPGQTVHCSFVNVAVVVPVASGATTTTTSTMPTTSTTSTTSTTTTSTTAPIMTTTTGGVSGATAAAMSPRLAFTGAGSATTQLGLALVAAGVVVSVMKRRVRRTG
jgi:hypothetical protein